MARLAASSAEGDSINLARPRTSTLHSSRTVWIDIVRLEGHPLTDSGMRDEASSGHGYDLAVVNAELGRNDYRRLVGFNDAVGLNGHGREPCAIAGRSAAKGLPKLVGRRWRALGTRYEMYRAGQFSPDY